jgi:hypothetical protein
VKEDGGLGRQKFPALHEPCETSPDGTQAVDSRAQVVPGRVSLKFGEHDPPCGVTAATSSEVQPLGTVGQVEFESIAGVPHGVAQFESEKNDTWGRGHVCPVGGEQVQLQTGGGTSRPADPWKVGMYEPLHVGAPASLATSANATGPVHPVGGTGAQT